MTFLAATATTHLATNGATVAPLSLPLGWLVLAALVLLIVYAVRCAARPFGPCRRCHGEGKTRPPAKHIGRTAKPKHCRRCDGTGLRLRIGRHLWNHLRRVHRDGTR